MIRLLLSWGLGSIYGLVYGLARENRRIVLV